MRLWTIHPRYLDTKGLVACWREGLLALNVLQGRTRGYKNHPQLDRFKVVSNPIQYISNYLHEICDNADYRLYNFNRSKLDEYRPTPIRMNVPMGQVQYEWEFLKSKVINRGGSWFYPPLFTIKECQNVVHPLFRVIPGNVELWEKVKF